MATSRERHTDPSYIKFRHVEQGKTDWDKYMDAKKGQDKILGRPGTLLNETQLWFQANMSYSAANEASWQRFKHIKMRRWFLTQTRYDLMQPAVDINHAPLRELTVMRDLDGMPTSHLAQLVLERRLRERLYVVVDGLIYKVNGFGSLNTQKLRNCVKCVRPTTGKRNMPMALAQRANTAPTEHTTRLEFRHCVGVAATGSHHLCTYHPTFR